MKFIRQLFLLGILCCWAPVISTAATPDSDENMHIYADHMSQGPAEGAYSADGHVIVLKQGMKLTADSVTYFAATHLMHASGSVVLTQGPIILKGETLDLNTDSGQAEMDSTHLTVLDSGMKISTAKLIRIDENNYSGRSSELTSCDIPDPSWKFSTDRLNVNLLGYATGHNVIFYIDDIPVLYLPWIAFPVLREKTSGLLFPRYGYSNNKGIEIVIPIYLVISPSQDIQLDLDFLSLRGIGSDIDYRYIRKRGSEGHISVYQIYDQLQDRWRLQLAQDHKEIFSSDANLRMTVNATSDRTFLGDFGEKSGDYNRQSNDTIINALKMWQNYAVNSYLRYDVGLYATDNRSVLQTVPSLGISGVRQSVYSLPLFFDIDGSIDNFYRESAPIGQRLSAFPRLTLLPFRNDFLQTTFYAGTHIRGYVTDNRGDNTIQSSAGDLLPEAGVRMSTSLARTFDVDLAQLKKIRHEIIPEIRYIYAQDRDQQRLPFYDYTDRMIYQNMISLSVTSLMNGKFMSGNTAEYRDLSRVKLEADYSVAGEQRDLLSLVGNQHHWSNLILESETWLSKLLRFTFDTRYNFYDNNLSTAVAGLYLDDRQGNTVGGGYQMARGVVEYFEGRFSTKMLSPFNLSYTARYSFDRNDFLESVYSAEYRHKCWSMNLAVHQRPGGNQSYSFSFNLAGLGTR